MTDWSYHCLFLMGDIGRDFLNINFLNSLDLSVEHSYTYNEGLYYHSERQEIPHVGALGVLSCVFIA